MLVDNLGRKIPQGMIDFVDKVMKVRTGKDAPWSAIDLCVEFWKKQYPKRYQSFLVTIKDLRETRKDPKFGQSKEGNYRYTLDIPQEVMFMIRKIYTVDELPMDRGFFQQLARRYPYMKVAEKL